MYIYIYTYILHESFSGENKSKQENCGFNRTWESSYPGVRVGELIFHCFWTELGNPPTLLAGFEDWFCIVFFAGFGNPP